MSILKEFGGCSEGHPSTYSWERRSSQPVKITDADILLTFKVCGKLREVMFIGTSIGTLIKAMKPLCQAWKECDILGFFGWIRTGSILVPRGCTSRCRSLILAPAWPHRWRRHKSVGGEWSVCGGMPTGGISCIWSCIHPGRGLWRCWFCEGISLPNGKPGRRLSSRLPS